MQISPSTPRSVHLTLANASTTKPINVYLGWEIFLSRVFKERMDKGLWLHWYHPVDRDRRPALRYGYFIAPNQTLEDALHAVYQSIEAIVELESMENVRSFVQAIDHLDADRALLSVNT